MNIDRLKTIQAIYARLARLEDDREAARIEDKDCSLIDIEITALRLELSKIMNSLLLV